MTSPSPDSYSFRTYSNGTLPVHDASEPGSTGNPWRGFYHAQCWITIGGSDKYPGSPGSGLGQVLRGPQQGSLVLLFLFMKNGDRAQVGNWVQEGSSHPIGGWTLWGYNDLGTGGPKILIYYRIATGIEQRNVIRWTIRTSTSGPVFSKPYMLTIPPFYYRSAQPFASDWLQYHRQYANSRSFTFPGGALPDNRSDTSWHLKNGGGTMSIAASCFTYLDLEDTATKYALPGVAKTGFGYGGIWYHMVAPDNGTEFYRDWGYQCLWAHGLPSDGGVLGDGIPQNWFPSRPGSAHVVHTLLLLPAPPDAVIPEVEGPISNVANLFEVNNLDDFFIVRGSGTPTIT